MKNALLHIVLALSAAFCIASCTYDYYPEEELDENKVAFAFNMRLLGISSERAADLPAERLHSLRVVVVDLGVNRDGVTEEAPEVEYNTVLYNLSLTDDSGNEGVVHLRFPKIRADREKKIYLLVNCEWLTGAGLKDAGGAAINLNNNNLYLPAGGTAPIEDATFVFPTGSHSKNGLAGGELFVPMTAVHDFSIPTIAELEKDYPLSANLVYTLPYELYIVRAINKITFDFINATKGSDNNGGENDGVELLVKEWSMSKINTGASFLFAKPGDNGTLFNGYAVSASNGNAPWMQWLRDEAERSLSPETYAPQWLMEYGIPSATNHSGFTFAPANPALNEGYVLPAPAVADNKQVTYSTSGDPVYFAESKPVTGQPQQYELSFTVMQKEDGEWNNEYIYRATSTIGDAQDAMSGFNLQSLFRSTHVKVTVIFRSSLGHPSMEIDVHPYGGYDLNPDFGL